LEKMKFIRGLFLLLLLLFLAIFVPRSWALPELTISNLFFSKEYPESNEVFIVSATVHNSGDDYSDPVFTKNPGPVDLMAAVYDGQWLAQSFNHSEDVNLTGVSLFIKDVGNDDSLIVTIETNTTGNLPSGFAIASSTENGSDDGYYWVDFMFSGLVSLSANTTYWIVMHNYAVADLDGYKVVLTSYNYYGYGIETYSYDQGGTWAEWTGRDLLFEAYRSTTTIVKFYDGDPDLGGFLIGTDEISPVPSGGSVTASISTCTSAGYHTIYAHVNRDNYIVESDTANNKAHKTIAVDFPRVVSAETIDDDLDGCIDAYHIVFNEEVEDSNPQFNPTGFAVEGHSITGVLTTLPNHPDVLNDGDIYLCFTESGIPDTGLLPEITYSSSTGKLTDFEGNPLLDIGPSDITETDGTSPAIHSLLSFPQNGALGIPIDIAIQIIFAEEMNVYTTTSAIKVEAIVNKDGEIITPEVVSGTFSSSYDANTCRHKFIFQPVAPLRNNYTYQVTVDTNATDTVGKHLGGFELSFATIANCKESNTFVSDDGKLKITLDAGTLKEDFFVQVNASPLEDSPRKKSIVDANKKLDMDDDPFSFILDPTIVEIEAFDAQKNPITEPFAIPAAIALLYEDGSPEDGIVDDTSPAVREETLAAYWLNEKNSLWVKLPESVVDKKSNIVIARTFHFSVFSLHGAGTTDLSDAYAYPVPFLPSRGDLTITFTNISPVCKIKIYTLNGELVATIDHTTGETSYPWNVTNDRGDRLASGVYLYIIKNEKYSKKGKLIIIR